MKKKTRILLSSYLTALVLTLALWAWAGQWGLGWYRRAANESAGLAFEETVRAVERLSGVLDQSAYATDSGMCERICCEACASAAAAQSAMSALPFSTQELEGLSAFLNTAGDYALSLSGSGEVFTPDQLEDLRAMGEAAGDFSRQLLAMREALNGGELRMDSRERRLRNVEEPGEERLSEELLAYEKDFRPLELHYDGKYGGEAEKKSAGLLTEEEMLQAAADFAGLSPEELTLEYQYEGGDGRRCYRAGDAYLCVGRSGVESMSRDRVVSEENLSAEEALEAAEAFLKKQGYGDLRLTEQTQNGCVAAFSFAREQDGALCPDCRVRLALCLDDGSLYGFDASDFRRETASVRWELDEEAARAALPEGVRVTGSARQILRSPGGLNVPCYVFSCRDASDRAVEIAVRADTGKQFSIRVSPRNGE